jgi:endo-1,4-beta-xylanase
MTFRTKLLISALLVLAPGAMLFGIGTQEPKKESTAQTETVDKTEDTSEETKYVIVDFEDSAIPLRVYNEDQVRTKPEFITDDVHSGKQALRITTEDVAPQTGYFAGVDTSIPDGKGNWSALRTMKLWVEGSRNGAEIRIVLEDAQKEQFTQSFFDNFKGWKEISLPIKKFVPRTDYQDPKARLNNRLDYPLAFIHFFTSDKGGYTLVYDDIIVTDEGRKKGDDEDEEEFVPRVKPAHTLRELTADYDIDIGAAATASELKLPDLGEVMARDFGSLTAGNEMKMYTIRREKDSYNFEPADTLLAFAKEHGMKMRGHTLVWHNLPQWMQKTRWTKESLLDFLHEYITTVVMRYKDDLYCWDVVNEPIADSGDYRNKDSLWYKVCGDEYIEKAFIWAHEADPDAILFINDYNVETVNRKSNKLYEVVKNLLAKGVPVGGVGFQVHFIEDLPPNFTSMYKNVKRFAELGVDIHFTEVDVRIRTPIADSKLKHQAEIYGEITKIALSVERVKNITMWGISDLYSWIPSTFPGYGYAHLFDRYFNPKPAYYSMQVALVAGPAPDAYEAALSSKHLVAPFTATNIKTAPEIDGTIDRGEWDGAVVYPFGYNQLDGMDSRLPGPPDLDGDWRIAYSDGTIYGLVRRTDDITVTDLEQTWENDTIEIFFGTNNEFVQLRTVIGQDFEKHVFTGKRKAVWSKDGTVLEFSIDLGYGDLAGTIIGWNIALADNDGGEVRQCQAYPANGSNKSWQGEGFGELAFTDKGVTPERPGDPYFAPALKAKAAVSPPVLDGAIAKDEWDGAVVYQFSFNRLGTDDLTPPSRDDLYGSFRVVFDGNTVYGLVERMDDKTIVDAKNPTKSDAVVLFVDVDNTFVALRSVVGSDFGKNSFAGTKKAIWSKAGDVLEFKIELPGDSLKGSTAGWDIMLADSDAKSKLETLLSPFSGKADVTKDALGLVVFE